MSYITPWTRGGRPACLRANTKGPSPRALGVHAVFLVERRACAIGLLGGGEHAVPVIGMQPLDPEPRVLGPLGGLVTEEDLELRAHVDRGDLAGRDGRVPGGGARRDLLTRPWRPRARV